MKNRHKRPRRRPNSLFLCPLLLAGALTMMPPAMSACAQAEAEAVAKAEKPVISDPRGFDPFLPFIKIVTEKPKTAAKKEKLPADAAKEPVFVSPLERYDVKEFRLRGIAGSGSLNVAVVEDRSGKIYTLYQGSAIGLLGGRVMAILSDRVIVEQMEMDAYGKEAVKKITLRLERDEDRGKL